MVSSLKLLVEFEKTACGIDVFIISDTRTFISLQNTHSPSVKGILHIYHLTIVNKVVYCGCLCMLAHGTPVAKSGM